MAKQNLQYRLTIYLNKIQEWYLQLNSKGIQPIFTFLYYYIQIQPSAIPSLVIFFSIDKKFINMPPLYYSVFLYGNSSEDKEQWKIFA